MICQNTEFTFMTYNSMPSKPHQPICIMNVKKNIIDIFFTVMELDADIMLETRHNLTLNPLILTHYVLR